MPHLRTWKSLSWQKDQEGVVKSVFQVNCVTELTQDLNSFTSNNKFGIQKFFFWESFLGWDPSKSNEKQFDVCRIFLMSALITLSRISMKWAHAFLWVLPVTNFKPLLYFSLIKSGKSEKGFSFIAMWRAALNNLV